MVYMLLSFAALSKTVQSILFSAHYMNICIYIAFVFLSNSGVFLDFVFPFSFSVIVSQMN